MKIMKSTCLGILLLSIGSTSPVNTTAATFLSKTNGTTSTNGDAPTSRATESTLPFKVSTDIPNDATEFPNGTHWYRLTLSGCYWIYDTTNKYVKAEATNYGSIVGFDNDNALWCITGNETDGFKIYNKAAGPQKTLLADNRTSDSETPLKIGDPTSTTHTWLIKYTTPKSDSPSGWNIVEKDNSTNYINNRASKVGIWRNAGAAGGKGSSITFKDLSSLAQDAIGNFENVVNGYSSENMADFKAAISVENLTYSALISAYDALKEKEKVQISTEKFYEIGIANIRSGQAKQYVSINNDHKSRDYTANSPELIWHFKSTGENGKYYLCSNGFYLGRIGEQNKTYQTTNVSDAGIYTIESLNASQSGIKCINLKGSNADCGYLHESDTKDLTGWKSGNDQSRWYITEAANASSVENVSSNSPYATRCFPTNVRIPENMTAYYGTINGENIQFHTYAEAGNVINKNTPVMLLANNLDETAKTFMFEPVTDANNNTIEGLTNNVLIGSPEGGITKDAIDNNGKDAYVLAKKGEPAQIGFYTFIGNTIPAYYAYITLDKEQAANIKAFSFDFDNSVTTAIESVSKNNESNIIYDLNGKIVAHPTKGFYIKNNRKLIIK